jgi:DNA uptake protein ComE-like DNA-binding protein
MNSFRFPYFFTIILFLVFLSGCTQQQRTQDLKEKTAQATAEAKRDTKAIVAGIREGWNRDKPLDINSATKDQLVTLPGVTAPLADRIIAGRPYKDPADLVTRHIVRKTTYGKIADRLVAKH